MKSETEKDLEYLAGLAFHRVEKCGDLVRCFHALPKQAKNHPGYKLIKLLHPWLLVPFSLWPIDCVGLGYHLLKCIRAKQPLDAGVILLFSFLNKLPSKKEQAAVAAHEHQVRTGDYESYIAAKPKFTYKAEVLKEDPDFKAHWNAIKSEFDVANYRDAKGIIRRRMGQERNFRPKDWNFRWRTSRDRFEVVFDAFCQRWILYGMEGDEPLLQKFSVNVTPFGTMLFIPRYWSLDGRRDIEWAIVNKLHRSREVRRQGEKLSRGELERKREAIKVQELWRQSKEFGLKGEKRKSWVIEMMRWHPETDFSRVSRLLQLAKRFTQCAG
jgi:hypothetical protein